MAYQWSQYVVSETTFGCFRVDSLIPGPVDGGPWLMTERDCVPQAVGRSPTTTVGRQPLRVDSVASLKNIRTVQYLPVGAVLKR
jgi:hypothetical protein